MKWAGSIEKWRHNNFHKQLKKKNGKAIMCESTDCKSVNPKRFEWALKKGCSYSSNREDYLQLCPSCHRFYDYTEDHKRKLKEAKYGDKHNKAKLTNEQVLIIKEMILSGRMIKDIATEFNMHQSSISDIKSGKRWGYLTGLKSNKK